MKKSQEMLCFSEKEGGNMWKDYMEGIMNKEIDWDHNVDGDVVECPEDCIGREEVVQTLNDL